MLRKEDALAYHSEGRPGKLEVVPTKALASQRDLSLAYSPGVAEPCRAIRADPRAVGRYTARRNLVAVVTNGTAVLGLGDIGPLAAKPVMEGKAVLFKKYADIDVFDIEVDAADPERFCDVVAALEPTFGGINLEDIKAPECFFIEETLEARMGIPVFHDDQHGTAIISAAALLNASELQEKELAALRVVCIGAGAAALGSMRLWTKLGVKRENITLFDLDGVITTDREGVDRYRRAFAQPPGAATRDLGEALEGADVMIGLAAGGIVKGEMLKRMNERPIVFALANPDPEIGYEEARAARPDAIVGTGRSDFPNQVNNVLGFPYLFRGALDVAATHIVDEMKLAAARALADLARIGVDDAVLRAYGGEALKFGKDYVIPKPGDPRSLSWLAPAVAEAAMKAGVAQESVDVEAYREQLTRRLDPTRRVLVHVTNVAKRDPCKVVFPEGENDTILRAVDVIENERIALPVLLGRTRVIRERAEELGVDLKGVEIVDSQYRPKMEAYVARFHELRQRKGITLTRARRILERSRTHYALMMLEEGDVGGVLSGITAPYSETIRPALQIIGVAEGVRRAAGCYLVVTKGGLKLFADTTVNVDPDEDTLVEAALLSADLAEELGLTPRVAMLSFSNFGDAPHAASRKMARAADKVRALRPGLAVDGEMQADVALLESRRAEYPFHRLGGDANVLVFPNLGAGNIAYKLLASFGSELVGPLVLGMRKPVNVLQQGTTVSTIVHMASLTVARARRQRG
ncbi:MAG: NADP-dependent malic enzyme [Myxococcota bacterium]